MLKKIADPEVGRGFEVYKDHDGWSYAFSPTIGVSESIYKVDVQTHGLYDYRKINSKGVFEGNFSTLQGITVTISLFWIQLNVYLGRFDIRF